MWDSRTGPPGPAPPQGPFSRSQSTSRVHRCHGRGAVRSGGSRQWEVKGQALTPILVDGVGVRL